MLSIRSTHTLPVLEDVELGGSTRYGPAKTPGRGLVAANAPRTLMKENASTYTSRTAKGKRVMYPSTPGAGLEKIQPQRLFHDKGGTTVTKPNSTIQTILRVNPLLDKTNKTPFILRHQVPSTPLPTGPSKLNLLDNALAGTPLSSLELLPSGSLTGIPLNVPVTLRPSSTRKSFRAPRSASRSFETPDARGRKPHWDISDGDISVELGHAAPSLEGIIIAEEDDDEVEYAPPPVPEPAYDPGYDMPDYKELGAAIMAIGRWPHLGAEPLMDFSSLTMDPTEQIECPAPASLATRYETSLFPDRQPPTRSASSGANKQQPTSKLKHPKLALVNSRVPTSSSSVTVSRPPTRLTGASKTASRGAQHPKAGPSSSLAPSSATPSVPSTSASRKATSRRTLQLPKHSSSTSNSLGVSNVRGSVKSQTSARSTKPLGTIQPGITSSRTPTSNQLSNPSGANPRGKVPPTLDDVKLGMDDDLDELLLQDEILSM